MHHLIPTLALILLVWPAVAAGNWAEKLGYPPGKKVLILHADDIGMCYEANRAAVDYLCAGHIQSAAAMVPCPWFDEFADWYTKHPEVDVGLHLTLTSEWRHYRWGSTARPSTVPGLLDDDGYLHRSVREVVLNAKPAEVETEIRAQIERALSRGIRPGHIDTHMGTLYGHPAFTKVYLRVAEEYHIPAMVLELTPEVVKKFRARGYPFDEKMIEAVKGYSLPRLDDFRSVESADTYEKKRSGFLDLVRSLRPGITEIIFHPSVDTEGLRKITNSWQQRVWESRLFSDPVVREFLEEKEKVLFTNWKEMMKRFDANQK